MTVDNVEIIGADRFARTTRAAAADIAQMDAAAEEAGRIIAAQGAANAPRRTGALARSISSAADTSGVVIGSELIYAPVIHYGWHAHNIAANPFLARALDLRTTQVTDAYARQLDLALGKVEGA